MPGDRLPTQLQLVLDVVHSAEPATRWATTRGGQSLFRVPVTDLVVSRDPGLLAFVPAEHRWQVPGILGWRGGARYGLEPLEHVVTLRGWQRRFGRSWRA
jgi:hypothetical protein